MQKLDDRTPVLVGIGTVQQRGEYPERALEAVALMAEAARRAAADASPGNAAELLAAVQRIAVPRGLWGYTDPARQVARRIGATAATTVRAEIGILQQTLFGEACQRIERGELEVALVVGGEAKYRALRAQLAGVEAAEIVEPGEPDEVLRPETELYLEAEINSGLGHMPVGYYAIMESAWRAAKGWSVAEHRDRLAAMYSEWSAIAATNPDAWKPQALTAAEIRDASLSNPMLAFPYTKLHNTSWNVDQAAALLFCSVAKARALGIPEQRWVFPLASTESNHMLCVSQKPELHRLPGARIAGARALDFAGLRPADVELLELYSCFPIAIEIYAEELQLPAERPWTVTGGMPFAGGPLNNFVLQATCKMAQRLRERPAASGLVTSVSGLLTKQGFGLWSARAPRQPFRFDDVTAAVRAESVAKDVVAEASGNAAIVGYTVLYQQGRASRAVAVLELPDGRRTLGWNDDARVMADMETAEFVGRTVAVAAGRFTP